MWFKNMKWLAWDKDEWFSKQGNLWPFFDKFEHFVRDFVFFWIFFVCFWAFFSWVGYHQNIPIILFSVFGYYKSVSICLPFAYGMGLLFNTGYEMYNGYVPYSGENIQGFSKKDWIAGFVGTSLAFLILYSIL